MSKDEALRLSLEALLLNLPLIEDFGSKEDLNRQHRAIFACEDTIGVEERKGWVCAKCGVDRTRDVCPKGHTAAITGDCPMIVEAQ